MATDVVTLITNDHRVVETLFERLQKDEGDRAALVKELHALLTAHARAEEDRVYGAIENQEAHHGLEEHKKAEILLDALKKADPAGPAFEDTLAKLVEAVRHHVEEEEKEILPELARSLSKKRLEELGRAFKQREDEELRALRGDGRPSAKGAAKGTAKGAAKGAQSSPTRDELYERAKKLDIPGRSSMTKQQLEKAIKQRS
ncbi:hemerythrin domain-containing protein [Thermoactinospora rubra]|uniref:hemerythrin domain-containing protein n=1 Tax=Thermoactinospora rubra TaxID=1088767 RepID=UPI000A0F86FE|nr:hemerythrin domain-containing protein [Thermoactinospora rubra]